MTRSDILVDWLIPSLPKVMLNKEGVELDEYNRAFVSTFSQNLDTRIMLVNLSYVSMLDL